MIGKYIILCCGICYHTAIMGIDIIRVWRVVEGDWDCICSMCSVSGDVRIVYER